MEPRSVSRVPVFRTEIRRLDEQWRRLGGYGGVNGVRTRYTIKIRNHSLGSLKKQTSTRGKVTQIPSKYSALRMEPRFGLHVPVLRTATRLPEASNEQWHCFGGVNGARTR